jgi:hypothetical protein
MIGDDDYGDEDGYGEEDGTGYVPVIKGAKKKDDEGDYDFM